MDRNDPVRVGQRQHLPERRRGGVFGTALQQRQVRWQGHLAKPPVLDLMDETNRGLFSLVTFKSLSLLHRHADFYGHLRQSAAHSSV